MAVGIFLVGLHGEDGVTLPVLAVAFYNVLVDVDSSLH
jgi:hypothetical protein